MITKEQVKDTIHKVLAHYMNENHNFDKENGELTDIDELILSINQELVKRVEELKPRSEWIPCNERLPEKYDGYLVAYEVQIDGKKYMYMDICEGEVTEEWDHENNRWKFEWIPTEAMQLYRVATVKAWMPLPEKYVETED